MGDTAVLPHRIAEIALTDPDRRLMLRADTGEVLTYGEVHAEAMRWAGALHSLGVQEGEAVASLLQPSSAAYASWLGLAWLRAVEVPVNTMLHGDLLHHVLSDSGCRFVVTEVELLPSLTALLPRLPAVKTVVVIGAEDGAHRDGVTVLGAADLLHNSPSVELEGPGRHDISCLSYTSGTTGPAKGVLVPWAELHEFVGAVNPPLGPEDVYYSTYPMFHVSGKHVLDVAATCGGRLVFRERFSVTELWNDVREHGVTIAGLVGPMARMLMAMPPSQDDADNPMRRAAVGPLFPEIKAFEQRFGVEISTGYGMTEIGAPLASPPGSITDWQSCGRERAPYQLRIVDELDREVPVGEVGELVVRSDVPWTLNAGYHAQPEATLRAWRNGWFHTGDAFRRNADGDYYFVDRIKDTMRRRGQNISSFEVETQVLQVPGVAECAALGVPSPLGEDDIKIVVVLTPDSTLVEATLLAELEEAMPKFMLPRYVELATVLPKTHTQRVRKVELRDGAMNARTWDRETGGHLQS